MAVVQRGRGQGAVVAGANLFATAAAMAVVHPITRLRESPWQPPLPPLRLKADAGNVQPTSNQVPALALRGCKCRRAAYTTVIAKTGRHELGHDGVTEHPFAPALRHFFVQPGDA